MHWDHEAERRAIARLIRQIDAIDYQGNAVGRRVVALFLVIFACAAGLLFWAVTFGRQAVPAEARSGPRAPAVLRSFRD